MEGGAGGEVGLWNNGKMEKRERISVAKWSHGKQHRNWLSGEPDWWTI
jgi:hypothetical protein